MSTLTLSWHFEQLVDLPQIFPISHAFPEFRIPIFNILKLFQNVEFLKSHFIIILLSFSVDIMSTADA